MRFLVALYRKRANDLPETSFLQRGHETFGPKATAERFLSTTAAGHAMDKINVGAGSALGIVTIGDRE